jgi:hypothetical protein
VLGGERGEVGAAGAGGGEQDAGADPGVGEVLAGPPVRAQDARAEQRARRLRAPGVPDRGDPPAVQSTAEARDRGLDAIELVVTRLASAIRSRQIVGVRGSSAGRARRRESR